MVWTRNLQAGKILPGRAVNCAETKFGIDYDIPPQSWLMRQKCKAGKASQKERQKQKLPGWILNPGLGPQAINHEDSQLNEKATATARTLNLRKYIP